MQTEITLQVVMTINADDEDDHEAQVEQIVSGLEGQGFDVLVEDEERLDDVFDLLLEDAETPFDYGDDEDE